MIRCMALCLFLSAAIYASENPLIIPDLSFSKVVARTTIELNSPGKASQFDTHISYEGAEADRLRELYEQWGADELEHYFNDYFEEHFGKLEKVADLEVRDDLAKNAFHVKGSYLLHDLWNHDPDEQIYYFNLFPAHIVELINFNIDPLRETPLSLDHPTHVVERITLINKDEEWPEMKSQQKFDGEEVIFRYAEKSDGNTLQLRYEFQTKKDHVPADRVIDYHELLKEVENLFIFSIRTTADDVSFREMLENDNYIVLGSLTICYAWIIAMLCRKKKRIGGLS